MVATARTYHCTIVTRTGYERWPFCSRDSQADVDFCILRKHRINTSAAAARELRPMMNAGWETGIWLKVNLPVRVRRIELYASSDSQPEVASGPLGCRDADFVPSKHSIF